MMSYSPEKRNQSGTEKPRADGVVVSTPDGAAIEQDLLEKLEDLDDAIFAAIDGDPEALDNARHLLLTAEIDIDGFLLEEAREQYARRAEAVWQAERQTAHGESLAKSFAALEVLKWVTE